MPILIFLFYLGHSLDGFGIRIGVSPGVKDQGFSFTLLTPDRSYNLSAETELDRDQWIQVLEQVIDRPLTPQDTMSKLRMIFYMKLIIKIVFFSAYTRLVRRRTNTNSMNIFSVR